jgi:ribosomal protein S18 acetylase RimI-like enzyme
MARVHGSSAAHHARLVPGFYRVPEVSVVAQRYREAGASDYADALVAELDGLIIGMALLKELASPSSDSMLAPVPTGSVDVAVLDGYRGMGVGEQLMHAIERSARSRGMRRLQLDVAVANDRALSFYRDRLGYADFGVLLRLDI